MIQESIRFIIDLLNIEQEIFFLFHDLSKAFYTLNHYSLLNTLDWYKRYQQINSYFYYRKFKVATKTNISKEKTRNVVDF